MKIVIKKQQQLSKKFSKSILIHGGKLRNKRAGRNARPLSTKNTHHIVFKIKSVHLQNKSFRHPKNFALVSKLLSKYAARFFVKIEQISYQHNHIHILARSSRRSGFHNFFRVFAGQIAQKLKVTDTPSHLTKLPDSKKISLWDGRPFTRIINSWRSFRIVKHYIQLNELEVTLKIAYKKDRLRGLSNLELKKLWDS